MEQRAKRKRTKEGDVIAINLGNLSYGYGIVLNSSSTGFYNLQTKNLELNVNFITSHSILFKVPVMNSAFKSEKWHIIGNIELNDDLKQRVYFFTRDMFDHSISIYYEDGTEGIDIPATYEEVKDLERAAVWDPEHVEDRLRDHFNGVPNEWVKQLRPKPSAS